MVTITVSFQGQWSIEVSESGKLSVYRPTTVSPFAADTIVVLPTLDSQISAAITILDVTYASQGWRFGDPVYQAPPLVDALADASVNGNQPVMIHGR